MATSKESIQRLLTIGIVADENEAIRSLRRVDAALRDTKDKTDDYSKALRALYEEHKAGEVSTEAYSQAVAKLNMDQQRHIEKIEKLTAAYRQLLQAQQAAARGATSPLMGFDPTGQTTSNVITTVTPANGRSALLGFDPNSGRYTDGSYGYSGGAMDAHMADYAMRRAEIQATRNRTREEYRNMHHQKAMAGLYEEYQAAYDAEMEKQALRAEGTSYMQQYNTRGENRNRALAEAAELHKKGAINAAEHARAVSAINQQYSLTGQAMGQIKGVAATLFGPLTATIMAGEGIRRMVQLAAEQETTQARFSVFTGSQASADGVLGGLRDLTARTPISFSGASKAATTLLQYGGSADSVVDQVKQLGTIAGSDPDQLQRLALAYGQVQGAGRLMGQELLQMINAGFNPLMVISDKTGESLLSLKRRMEEGGVSAGEVTQALEWYTEAGGRYAGMLDRMAETTAGKWAKLRTELEKTAIVAGNLVKPVVDYGLNNATSGIGGLRSIVSGEFGNSGPFDTNALQRNASVASWIPLSATKEYARVVAELANVEQLRKKNLDELNATQRTALALQEAMDRAAKSRDMESDPELYSLRRGRDLAGAVNNIAGMLGLPNLDTSRINEAIVRRETELEFERSEKAIARSRKEREARIADAFRKPQDSSIANLIDAQYGIYGNALSVLRGTMDTSSRGKFDSAIESGASWQELRGMGSTFAQGKFDELVASDKKEAGILERIKAEKEMANAIMEANRQREDARNKFREQRLDIEAEIKYKQELISLGKEEAEIRKMIRANGGSVDPIPGDPAIGPAMPPEIRERLSSQNAKIRAEAQAQYNAQRRLELMDPLTAGPAVVPRAMQSGSREMFAAQAAAQAGAIAEQIKLQREALRVAQAQLLAQKATNEHLENIGTV